MAFYPESLLLAFWTPLSLLPFSTTAPIPAFSCRCGTLFSTIPLLTDSLDSIASPAPFHNGSVFRDSLPLRYIIFRRTLSTDLLDGIASLASFHNGSISRDSLPLWNGILRRILAAGLLDAIVSSALFHNGTDSRIFLPLRYVIFHYTIATDSLDSIASPALSTTAAFSAILCRCGTSFPPHPFYRPSGRRCLSGLLPQRQHFPRFSAVAVHHFPPHPFYRPSGRRCLSVPFPQRHRFPHFSAIVVKIDALTFRR